MPYWIQDNEGRLVKIKNPHEIELELCVKVMQATPEDQHSQHASEENINGYRAMRDCMQQPRMSAPSCIVPPIKQLLIQPHIVPHLPTFMGWKVRIPMRISKNLRRFVIHSEKEMLQST